MIEHTTGFKTIMMIIIKPLMAALIAFGWWPTTQALILQVNDYVLLNPNAKILLEESRLILGVLISAAVLVKIIKGIAHHKKEKSE